MISDKYVPSYKLLENNLSIRDDYNKFVWYPAPVSDTLKPDGN